MHIVMLEERHSVPELLEAPDGTRTFSDKDNAIAAAYYALRGLEPKRVRANIFELRLVTSVIPGEYMSRVEPSTQKPVAWRWLNDSPHTAHPEWHYTDGDRPPPEHLKPEPLYAAPKGDTSNEEGAKP
jgi:hypothetical protein